MNGNEPRVPLEVLEPGDSDPTYWDRFQLRVIEAARSTLSHRRRASVTLGGIVVSWGRLILPLAAAAGLSALLVSGGTDPSSQGIAGVEEVLEPPDGEEPLPSFLHSDELVDRDLVLFAVEGFKGDAMALGNGRRARLGATVVLTAVFALGIAAGAGLNREEQATAPDPETRVSTEPTGRTEPPNEWIIDRMNLSMDQRAQVDSVVQHYGSRMSELQKAYRPQYRAIVDSTDGTLRSLLGGEQLLRYDSLLPRLRDGEPEIDPVAGAADHRRGSLAPNREVT